MLDLRLAERGGRAAGAELRLVNTWSDDAGTIFARAYADGAVRSIEWPGVGIFEFTQASPTVVLHASTTDIGRAHDIFRRIVQPIILQARGAEVLHASAVAGPWGAIVFAGTSGHGKSTLAWTLGRRQGFRQVADDAVVIGGLEDPEEASGICVCPLPYLPRLRPAAHESLLQDERLPRITLEASMVRPRLSAIVLLEQADAAGPAARPTRLTPSEAFTAVLTHAYCFDEADRVERERMVRHYFDIAAAVPAFRLCYRPDFATLPSLIETIVAHASAVGGGRA